MTRGSITTYGETLDDCRASAARQIAKFTPAATIVAENAAPEATLLTGEVAVWRLETEWTA